MDVEYIKCLTAQLQFHSLSQWKALEQRKVGVVDRRTPEDIASQASERSGIVWYPEGAWIKPGRGSAYGICGAPTVENSPLAKRIGIGRYRAGDERVGNKIRPQVVVRRTRSSSAKIGKISGN